MSPIRRSTRSPSSPTRRTREVIEPYTDQLQQRIRNDPFAVRKLRFVFLKLKSTLEMPLLRISQIESPDMYSVSEYYSSQLAHYVRNVVEVVPISMFEILNEIVGVQTNALKELPTKLEKTALKEYGKTPSERNSPRRRTRFQSSRKAFWPWRARSWASSSSTRNSS